MSNLSTEEIEMILSKFPEFPDDGIQSEQQRWYEEFKQLAAILAGSDLTVTTKLKE